MTRARARRVVAVAGAVAVLALLSAGCVPERPIPTSSPSVTAAATPAPTPADAAGMLLAAADAKAGPGGVAASACAVSFVADGVSAPPQLQQQGERFAPLPVPTASDRVFAGWYADPQSAAAREVAHRINGARLAACTDRRLTLYGGWETPAQFAAAKVRVPILMYHQFTANPQGEKGWLRGNFVYTGAFDEQLAHIAHGGFYLPTWDELDAFIDRKLALPPRSLIITDDDAAPSWFELAVPIVNKYRLLTTSFVITQNHPWPVPSIWVQQRSHTNDMHRAGANGKGLMVNLPADKIAADLEVSAQILGAKEVLAYPFGHHDATAEQGVRRAGFAMAVTVAGGYVTPGADKVALPRVRVSYGMTLAQLTAAIG